MSSDLSEKTLVALAKALRVARLEAIVIGNSASMLNGAPVTTQDIDLLIRDTRTNRRKLLRFAEEIGGSVPMPVSELSKVEWIEGRLAVPVEIHYDRISGGLTFSSIRSRAQIVDVGDEKLRVAALSDIIRSKQAAARPKDRAVLPILRDTLAVKKKLESSNLTSPGATAKDENVANAGLRSTACLTSLGGHGGLQVGAARAPGRMGGTRHR